MQSVSKWNTSLSQSVRRLTQKANQHSLHPQTYRYSSSVPQPSIKGTPNEGTRPTRKVSKGWSLEDHLVEPAGAEQRVKPRIIKDDDSDLIDTNSLLNTLLAHQKANAERVRIRTHLGPNTQEIKTRYDNAGQKTDVSPPSRPRIERPEMIAKHVKLEPQQFLEKADYVGEVQSLAYDWEMVKDVPRYLRLPWMAELDSQKPSRELATRRLTTEIQALNRFFSPTRDEVVSAQKAFDDVREAILQSCNDIQRVDLIGSRASGLATALSDLDINLVLKSSPTDSAVDAPPVDSVLTRIFKKLRFDLPTDSPVKAIYHARMARIPIIAGVHASTGLEFQIQVATSAYGSLALVKALNAEWPTLQALFIVFKQMLQMRGLNQGRHGGITSYPLLNMIVVSLKYHQVETDRYDVGKQFLEFLDFWCDMDFYTTGITHHPSMYLKSRLKPYDGDNPLTAPNAVSLITQDPVAAIPVKFEVRKKLADIHDGKNNFRLALHDPANPHNDLGRSSYRVKHVQATLLSIRKKVKEDMIQWDKIVQEEGEAEHQPVALLKSLVEGDYSIYNLNRRRLLSSEREAYEQAMT